MDLSLKKSWERRLSDWFLWSKNLGNQCSDKLYWSKQLKQFSKRFLLSCNITSIPPTPVRSLSTWNTTFILPNISKWYETKSTSSDRVFRWSPTSDVVEGFRRNNNSSFLVESSNSKFLSKMVWSLPKIGSSWRLLPLILMENSFGSVCIFAKKLLKSPEMIKKGTYLSTYIN